MNIETKTVTISPQQAKRWLMAFNNNNRTAREGQVKQFAADMKNNRWSFTHQGIAFYEDGTLADGQHRLMAIVEANLPVKFLVTTGLPKAVAQTIDQNRPRMVHDAIRIGGENPWINKHVVAIVRFLLSNLGTDTRTRSINQIVDYANKYRDLIEAVDKITSTKKRHVTHAGISAAYVCALNSGISLEKIKHFADIMVTGEIAGPHENSVVRLREHLIVHTGCWIGNVRHETVRRAQRAIEAFDKGQPLAKLYMPPELIYPIPE